MADAALGAAVFDVCSGVAARARGVVDEAAGRLERRRRAGAVDGPRRRGTVGGDAGPWASSSFGDTNASRRWTAALDWREAAPGVTSRRDEARMALPDGRTQLDPIVETYLGNNAARVVRAVRSRSRSRQHGRPLTGPMKPRTMAEAVAAWKRREARRAAPMTLAERETHWNGRTLGPPLPAYDAVGDAHCTYTLGVAFAASPYKAALEATRPGYRDDLLRAPRVYHRPKWPTATHAYKDDPVLPSFSVSSCSEPGPDARHALTSAGAAARRDAAYGRPGSLHPVRGSLGPEEGSLHWASVPARNWFKLQSEKTRSFHGDSWIEIVQANAIHATTRDLAVENRAISNPKLRKRGRAR
ncbi:hypothetical protein JL720_3655 [Aureococcus anophagefferens]|nr:hypothetical protein JL720_3655 [Aureococcus anophagefferens]